MKNLLLAVALFTCHQCFAQWEPEVRITNDPANSRTSINNQRNVAACGDTVHVIWYDSRDGNNEIYYKRSTDEGLTWEVDTRLTNNSADSYHPSIAIAGSMVYAAWSDKRDGNYEIYFTRSTDRGATWETATRLTVGDSSSMDPSIAANGLIVSIAWYDIRDGNWEIYYKRSIDGGVTWEADTRLTNNTASSQNACIAVSDSMVYVVWGDFRVSVNGDIFSKRSTDHGVTWGPDVQLTENTAVSRRPCIAAYDGMVHVVWYDRRSGDNEIFYKHSFDGGITWGPEVQLTNSIGNSLNPSVAVSGSTVQVVWYDTKDGDLEIYYRKSEDEGLLWGAAQRLTNATFPSENPTIAIFGSVVHLVWTDSRDGNPEIYYRKDPSGGFALGFEQESKRLSDEQVTLFPNPASQFIRVDFRIAYSANVQMTLLNIMGDQVFCKVIRSGEKVDVSNVAAGIYFVILKQGDQMVTSRKLVIVK
jgi:hypothetical protein